VLCEALVGAVARHASEANEEVRALFDRMGPMPFS